MRRILAFVVVLLAATGGRAAVVSVSDGTFDVAGWEIVFKTFRSGVGAGALPGGSAVASQVVADGVPPPSRRIDLTIPASPTLDEYSSTFSISLRKGFVYDPMTQGPIATIDYEEDARAVQQAQLTGLGVRQGGELYYASQGVFTSGAWTHLVRLAIIATNFEHLTDGGVVQGEYPT